MGDAAMARAGPEISVVVIDICSLCVTCLPSLCTEGLPLHAGKQALHWQKTSHRFLSVLGIHATAQLILPPAHAPVTTLTRCVVLAADSSCPALAASLAVHSAAVVLQTNRDSCAAAALASLDEADVAELTSSYGSVEDTGWWRSLPVSVDTMSSWEALEEASPTQEVDDSTQLSRLCWSLQQHMRAAFALGGSTGATELLRWSVALVDARQTMRRRSHLRLLHAALVTLDPGSVLHHYAAKALLRSSGLGTAPLRGCPDAKSATHKRSVRAGNRKQAAAKSATDGHDLGLWIQAVVRLCGGWGNADVFSFLHALACVCAREVLNRVHTSDQSEPLLLCAPSGAQLQSRSGAGESLAALQLFCAAIAVLPVGANLCTTACEELALFTTACGSASAAFLALQIANRLATANGVLMSLLCGTQAGLNARGHIRAQDAECDIVLHALDAFSEPAEPGVLNSN